MHESFEAPGAIETWAIEHGHSLSYTRFYNGEKLPESVDGMDFLVIMGGPQSPATTDEQCPHFNAMAEIEFIRKAIVGDKFILGICLGAQLIGEALGAAFEHSPKREIGVFDLTLSEEAQNDPVFSTFPRVFPVGHWHSDMPGLTPTTAVLAASSGCPRQVLRYAPKIYGFQCHFEFTHASIEVMIQNNAAELEQFKGFPYVETAEALRSHDYTSINRLLFRFLDYIQAMQISGR